MKGIYYNDLPEEYPQGYVKEKATMEKPVEPPNPTKDDTAWEEYNLKRMEYNRQLLAFLRPIPASGFNVPSGTEVEYDIEKMWVRNTDRNVPTNDDLDSVAIPSKAVEFKEKWSSISNDVGGDAEIPIEPPVTERLYTPSEVLKMVEDVFESAAQYAYNVAMGLEQTEPNRNQYVDDLKKKMGIE